MRDAVSQRSIYARKNALYGFYTLSVIYEGGGVTAQDESVAQYYTYQPWRGVQNGKLQIQGETEA